MERGERTKFHSMPNVQTKVGGEVDLRNLYSLSLSQIRKRSDFGQYGYKPSPFVSILDRAFIVRHNIYIYIHCIS